MRTKSAGNAYHFMPEPDLNPIKISAHTIEEIKKTLPELPWEKIKRYTKALGLSESEARILAEEPATFRYFEGILESTKNTKAAAHWMLGPILKARNKTGQSFSDLKLKPVNVAELIEVVESGKISLNQAREELFPELLLNPGARVDELVQKLHLFQIEDEDHLILLAKSTLKKYPEKVKLYKQGKRGLMGFFMGELMKQSAGKANPELSRKLLQKCLEANCK
jgi:aspartyl-tRNA(Asn)/glutamyl-tRNA(Gln) amidotransferase subunit B